MQRQSNTLAAFLLGLLLLGGLFVVGYQFKQAVVLWKQADRIVSVKGLAERTVQADLVLWPINYSVSANTLEEVYAELRADEEKIRAFLAAYGFTEDEISTSMPEVTDQWANVYGTRPDERYRADAAVLVRSTKVELAKEAMANVDELVSQDVLLARSYERPQFLFTKLNEIKPEMIAEATADARRAAMQFAEDSGSTVGKIRTAQQGYFTIEDLDQYTRDVKRVRVVTTIEFFLLD